MVDGDSRRRPRRVLLASKFLHHVGGVETYIAWLADHLRDQGVEIAFFGMTPPAGEHLMGSVTGDVFLTPNRDYHGSAATKIRSAATSIYSSAAGEAMDRALSAFQPDLVHFQSTCYQLTPSVVRSVARRGIPSVTTAHEYKFVCSNQRLWDDGRMSPCTKCLDAGTAERIINLARTRCVKGSLGASMVAAAELPVSNSIWKRAPGLVHAPSRFIADLLEGDGSPVRGRVRYLDLAWGQSVHPGLSPERRSADVVYIGRLSVEKGIEHLITAWPEVIAIRPDARLKLYGAGSDERRLRELAADRSSIEFVGRYERAELDEILAAAAVTVHPSTWAENSPYTVRESLQHGVPAVVTDQGGLPEMVNRRTGTVVRSGDPASLAEGIVGELAVSRAGSPDLLRAVSERFVSDKQHAAGLLAIYGEAMSLVGGTPW